MQTDFALLMVVMVVILITTPLAFIPRLNKTRGFKIAHIIVAALCLAAVITLVARMLPHVF